MSQSAKQIEALSRELARIAGLRLRPPRKGDSDAIAAGELRSLVPPEFFHWYKCPFHGTWLQPEFEPYPHWQCQAMVSAGIPAGSRTAKCNFSRAAKFRTRIEKHIFRVARFLEDHA